MIDQNYIFIFAEFLGKSAALISLGFLFVLVFRRLSPAAKHTLMLRVFAAGLVIPLLWLMFPRWEVVPAFFADVESAALEASASTGADRLSEEILVPVISTDAQEVASAVSSSQRSWPELVFALWGVGLILFIIRSLVAARFLRKLEKGSRSACREINERFARLRAEICPQSKVVLLESSAVKSAFTWGIIRPRIVLPTGVSEWSSVDIEMILMHELEHVRRRDALAVLISRAFLALNWVNPLAWIAVRKTVQLREEACDRRVLQSGYPGQNYAEMLFRQASFVAAPLWRTSATAVAENGTIEQRIKMILNPSNEMKNGINDASLMNRILPTALLLMLCLVGMAGFAKGEKKLSLDEEVTARLDSLILPKVEFSDTPLSDALKFLQLKSVELDPERKGVVILDTRKRGKDFADTLITLKLSNVPIGEAIHYSTALAQLQYSVKNGAVVIAPRDLKQMAAEREAEERDLSQALGSNERKMKEIRFPVIEFRDTPLKDALAFIHQKSVELDVATEDPAKKGVNVILDAEGGNTDVKINLKLTNVPLIEVFRYTSSLAQAQFEVEAHTVRIYFPKGGGKEAEVSPEGRKEIAAVQEKLDGIIFPALEFRETPITDALEFIQHKSVELDTSVEDPRMKGINVVLDAGKEVSDIRISLKVSNTTLDSVLKYTATGVGGEIEIGRNAVIVRIPDEE